MTDCMTLTMPQRYCIEPPISKVVTRFPPAMKLVTFVIKSVDSLIDSAVAIFGTIVGSFLEISVFPPSNVSGLTFYP